MLRHARTPVRRRAQAALLAGVVLASSAVAVTAGGGTAAAADTCRTPLVREVTISQGLPSYFRLVRGREALVKFMLSEQNPSTCPNVASETTRITAATLTVQRPDGTGAGELLRPAVGSTAVVGEHGTSPVPDSGADPMFKVTGATLLSPAQAGDYRVTFTGTVDYQTRTDKGVVVASGRLPVSIKPGTTSTPITAVVAQPTKPLRLLVVPMHDAQDTVDPLTGAARDFDDDDEDRLVDGMPALGRIFPVADGVGPLGSSAGVQYRLSEGVVDLGEHLEVVRRDDGTTGTRVVSYLDDAGTFCGGTDSFDYVVQELAEHRTLYNAENPDSPVDRVVGVVSQRISRGPSTDEGSGCAEGYASLSSPESWVRVVGAAPLLASPLGPRQSTTGGLLAQELLHTYGGSLLTTGFHSGSVRADGTAPLRAYNTLQREYLPAERNRTASRFGLAPWDQYTTLFERGDWAFMQCVLGSTSATASTDCGSPAGATSSTALAAGGSFVMSGTTGGTAATTDAHTYFADSAPRDGEDPLSQYRLVERSAAGVVVDREGRGVRVRRVASSHGGHGEPTREALGAFDVALEATGQAAALELWRGTADEPGSELLYQRRLDGAPKAVQVVRGPSASDAYRYTSEGRSAEPALNPVQPLLAWTTRTQAGRDDVHVGPVDRTSPVKPVVVATDARSAAWHPSGGKLAVIRGSGDVVLFDVVQNGTSTTVSAGREVYDADLFSAGVPLPAAAPTWSPDGEALAVAIRGDLWELDVSRDGDSSTVFSVRCSLGQSVGEVGVGGCRRLTATSGITESSPSWSGSPTGAGALSRGVVSYGRSADGASPPVTDVWGLLAVSPGTQRLLVAGASGPDWNDRSLVVTASTGLSAADASAATARVRDGGSTASLPTTPFTATAGDRQASVVRLGGSAKRPLRASFVRTTPEGADVFVSEVQSRGLHVVAEDDQPQDLRLDVLVTCEASEDATAPGDDPVVTAARPTSVDQEGGRAVFSVSYRAGETCTAADTVVRLTDGYQVDREVVPGEPGTGEPPRGVSNVVIHTPTADSVLLQFQTLTVAGSAIGVDRAPRTDLAWTLSYSDGQQTVTRRLDTERGFPDVHPPAGGWPAGDYLLTAALADGSSSATVEFAFTDDRDGDLLRDSLDDETVAGRRCLGDKAVTNPANALADPDLDLLPTLFDPEPCVTRLNAQVKTTPSSINLSSSGTPITSDVRTTAASLLAVQPQDVRITQLAGVPVDLPAYALSDVTASSLVAKFSRSQFIALLQANGLTGYVPALVEVRSGATTVLGFDATSPQY